MRALGVVRLSRDTDESTSVSRQKERIEAYAKFKEFEIIAWAEDTDVSALKVPPFDRPQLGPWLTPERATEYDAIVAWKLDRLCRSTKDFVGLLEFADDNGVDIHATDDNLDLSSNIGRMVAHILAVFAEFEGNTIRQRQQQSRQALVAAKRWYGGHAPYGYKPLSLPDGGYILAIDPEERKVILEIVRRVVEEGESVRSICGDLTDRGVPRPTPARKNTVHPGRWSDSSVHQMLRHPSLMGQRLYNGELVRDPNTGMPLQVADPILSPSEFQRLQGALDKRSSPHAHRHGKAPLAGLLKCVECYGPVYRYPGKKNYVYRCREAKQKNRKCEQLSLRAPALEERIFDEFLSTAGALEVETRIFVPADDTSEALETAQSAYEAVLDQLSTTGVPSLQETLRKRLTVIEDNIAELQSKPSREAHYEYEGTGQTYRQYFGELDDAGKCKAMRDAGTEFFVGRMEGVNVLGCVIPPDMQERIRQNM